MDENTANLLEALQWALEYIDAIPADVQLPAMPGFDRDYVDTLVYNMKNGNLESLE